MGLRDQKSEKTILQKLENLERTIDAVKPTPVRHKLSELIIAMRKTVWGFDEKAYENLDALRLS